MASFFNNPKHIVAVATAIGVWLQAAFPASHFTSPTITLIGTIVIVLVGNSDKPPPTP